MKQKLRELGSKLQIKKGSILVYTLIVMMIMLATALSIFAVAVREKKSAGTTAASMQAFAVADSGSEIALNKIANVSTLNEVGSCADGGIVTGSIGTGMDYTLTFYDSGGNQLLNCTDSVSAVDKVKSVGRYGGTARAVEVAVAQTGGITGNIKFCYMVDTSSGITLVYGITLPNDATLKNCRDIAYDACANPANRNACKFELACFGESGVHSWSLSWASTITDVTANAINLGSSATWQNLSKGGNQGNFCGWTN